MVKNIGLNYDKMSFVRLRIRVKKTHVQEM